MKISNILYPAVLLAAIMAFGGCAATPAKENPAIPGAPASQNDTANPSDTTVTPPRTGTAEGNIVPPEDAIVPPPAEIVRPAFEDIPAKDAAACQTNADCKEERQYCHRPAGKCADEGKCAVKPQMCAEVMDEICGCDGKTYGNPCKAWNAGAAIRSFGKCQ